MDVEDLVHMLKQKPIITEKEGAIKYDYKGGEIEFRNIAFKHPLSQDLLPNQPVNPNIKNNGYIIRGLNLKI